MKCSNTERVAQRVGLVAAIAGTVVMLGACDALILDREPEIAHLEISSSEVSEVTLITSQWFVELEDPECPQCARLIHLVAADTTYNASLPFSRSYPFTSRLQFFAETYPTELRPATLSMTVYLDDEQWYNDSRRLVLENEDGERETLRFVYKYNDVSVGGG
ncbi:MAG: hypothetical protein OXH51_14985 [Gemmatimonadetes bacterium]|nr:hypothetical protein [Gemmatimonadota bacterium]MCY3677840.1 hypothetical protein [Gemmatimonadota bacterium]